jgi:hypothetical protein
MSGRWIITTSTPAPHVCDLPALGNPPRHSWVLGPNVWRITRDTPTEGSVWECDECRTMWRVQRSWGNAWYVRCDKRETRHRRHNKAS